MFCKYCGSEVNPEWKYCPKCQGNLMANNQMSYNNQAMANNQVSYNNQAMANNQMSYNGQANVVNEEIANAIKQKNDRNIAIIIIVFLVTFLLTFTGIPGAEFAFIIALVDIVAGFIKYPQSRAIKVLFWLFIAFVIFSLLVVFFLAWTCNKSLESCRG